MRETKKEFKNKILEYGSEYPENVIRFLFNDKNLIVTNDMIYRYNGMVRKCVNKEADYVSIFEDFIKTDKTLTEIGKKYDVTITTISHHINRVIYLFNLYNKRFIEKTPDVLTSYIKNEDYERIIFEEIHYYKLPLSTVLRRKLTDYIEKYINSYDTDLSKSIKEKNGEHKRCMIYPFYENISIKDILDISNEGKMPLLRKGCQLSYKDLKELVELFPDHKQEILKEEPQKEEYVYIVSVWIVKRIIEGTEYKIYREYVNVIAFKSKDSAEKFIEDEENINKWFNESDIKKNFDGPNYNILWVDAHINKVEMK